ncbi:phage tail spike protein [Staphylococcus chromogenes]|uniref:phage tail spike protein n=1 Tax=Staphylococcus chromogenes TaxID=46126 RepID=UPI0028868E60|nr:phage tail spike protein [Staphylococcus chromogenes]MDT0679634.1 phage tail spike protein [Staphylococcus chromogenes]
MLHVLDFEGNIIDFISKNDKALIDIKHERNIKDYTEILDITILASRAVKFKERNRVIFLDSRNEPREFIINRIEQDSTSKYSLIECNASYLEDIATGVPYPPQKFEKYTTTQALSDVLKDTGWKVSDDTEYNGTRTTSWTSYQSRFDVLKQLTTTYKMVIDFHIDLDSRKVKSRYVSLKEPKPLFKGKEIVRGKDLLGLKRTVDVSEVRTALVCLGPEKENGERIKLIVKDDEAQKQFGLPTRYIWDIYEPETEDENMTEQRLRTLGTTQLNKVKSAAVSYEVTSLDIKKAYPHEIIRLGDIVRVKDRDFTPALYVEGEVISETYNPLTNVSVYSFGNYVEYKESDLRAEFTKKLDAIRQKLNDGLTNVNTIVADVVEGKLEYFERKIIKGVEPPENPVNDMLWLDTSNPDVAVLRRYWEGQWINATAEKAEDIGAITREKALYSELTNTFVNLSIQHSKLLNEMHDVINSEYLVDFDLKDELNAKLDATVSIYNNIKSNLESMTDETATIGKLIDTQTLFLNYRTAMQNLYNVVERAKVAIDERFKLLQSQYTEEKFRDALQEIADKFGLQVNEQNQLEGEPNVVEKAVIAAREDTKEQLMDYVKSVDYQTNQQGLIERMESADAERKTLAGQISDRVTKSEYQSGLDNIKIGGVNLFQSYDSATHGNNVHPSITSTQSFRGKYWATTLYTADYLKKVLVPGEEYTYSYELEIVGLSEKEVAMSKNHGIIFYSASNSKESITSSYKQIERIIGNKFKVTQTFVAPKITDHKFLAYSGFYSDDGTVKYPVSSNLVEFRNLKLEKGNKATDYTEAPSDVTRSTDKKLTVAKTEILQDGEQISQRVSREVFNASSQTLNRVVSEFVNNTSDGMAFRYDENGNIQSHSIGPQGVKIKGDKVDIKLNKEFNLLVGDVSKKADETNIINKINLSREGLDINVNNIGLRGGDSVNYLEIKNNSVLSRGRFTRTWANNTDTANLTLGIRNGYLLVSNEDNGYNLYMTEKGLSTMMNAASGETAGTLEFHYQGYNENSRGVRLHSTYGAVALESDQSRIYTVANLTNNIESRQYGVYIRPFKDTRAGLNEFYFYVKDNDSVGDTDGVILYGNISDERGEHGSGIRFSKSRADNIVYITNRNGDIGTGDISVRMAEVREHIRTQGMLEIRQWNDARAYNQIKVGAVNTTNSVVMASHSGGNAYYGVGTQEMRVTDNNGYNGGQTNYKPIRASAFNNASLAEYKEDIKLWDYDALNVISKELELYQYKYKGDSDTQLNHRGLVIGDGYKTPSEFIFGDGVNLYEMITWALRAIQQLNEKLEALNNERTS